MKASEIERGKTYTIRHHAPRIYPVQVNSRAYAQPNGARRSVFRYSSTKLATGREIVVKSVTKSIVLVAYLSPMATGFFESSSISARCAARILFAA